MAGFLVVCWRIDFATKGQNMLIWGGSKPLEYLFPGIESASGFIPPGSKMRGIGFPVTPATGYHPRKVSRPGGFIRLQFYNFLPKRKQFTGSWMYHTPNYCRLQGCGGGMLGFYCPKRPRFIGCGLAVVVRNSHVHRL